MSLIKGSTTSPAFGRSIGSAESLSLIKKSLTVGAAGFGTVAVLEAVTGLRFDPAPAYLFAVELEGLVVALFTECSGLEVTRSVEEYAEGGNNNYAHKLPGRTSYANITLKRGLSVSRVLWDWFSVGLYDFNVQRINFSIIQGAPGHNLLSAIGAATGAIGTSGSDLQTAGFQALGRGFGKVKHWNVENAFPVRWKGPQLSTSSASTAIEEIEIAHHGLDLSHEVGTPMAPGASVVNAAVGLATG